MDCQVKHHNKNYLTVPSKIAQIFFFKFEQIRWCCFKQRKFIHSHIHSVSDHINEYFPFSHPGRKILSVLLWFVGKPIKPFPYLLLTSVIRKKLLKNAFGGREYKQVRYLPSLCCLQMYLQYPQPPKHIFGLQYKYN